MRMGFSYTEVNDMDSKERAEWLHINTLENRKISSDRVIAEAKAKMQGGRKW